jgi:hypothetical protein
LVQVVYVAFRTAPRNIEDDLALSSLIALVLGDLLDCPRLRRGLSTAPALIVISATMGLELCVLVKYLGALRPGTLTNAGGCVAHRTVSAWSSRHRLQNVSTTGENREDLDGRQ